MFRYAAVELKPLAVHWLAIATVARFRLAHIDGHLLLGFYEWLI
jgi:hypothetical protein